jgi:hypothetical protein
MLPLSRGGMGWRNALGQGHRAWVSRKGAEDVLWNCPNNSTQHNGSIIFSMQKVMIMDSN